MAFEVVMIIAVVFIMAQLWQIKLFAFKLAQFADAVKEALDKFNNSKKEGLNGHQERDK